MLLLAVLVCMFVQRDVVPTGMTIQMSQMKVTEQYFPVVLFIMLYKVALTYESVEEILKCNHSN